MLVLYAEALQNQILARHTSSCLPGMIPRLSPSRYKVRSNAIFLAGIARTSASTPHPAAAIRPLDGELRSAGRIDAAARPLDAAGGAIISLPASPPTPPPSARRGAALVTEPRHQTKSQAKSWSESRGEAPATSRLRERQSRRPLRRPFARSAAKKGKTPEPRG